MTRSPIHAQVTGADQAMNEDNCYKSLNVNDEYKAKENAVQKLKPAHSEGTDAADEKKTADYKDSNVMSYDNMV